MRRVIVALIVMLLGVGGYAIYAANSTVPLKTLGVIELVVSVEPFEIPPPPAEVEEDGELVDASTRERAYPEFAGRFLMPRLGVDVELRSMPIGTEYVEHTFENGEIVFVPVNVVRPPTFQHAYLVDEPEFGTPTSTEGTAYVALHSAMGRDAAGNPLTNPYNQETLVEPGDIFIVDGVEYEVASSQLIPKPELRQRDEVWTPEAGKLVILTCLQNPDFTPASKNVLTVAYRTDSQANPYQG